MRSVVVFAACLLLSACAGDGPLGFVQFGGPPLVSGKSPPAPYASNSEPQPVNSLPPGAEGVGASGPNARFPNAGAITVRSPI